MSGQSDNTNGRALTLHAVNMGSISALHMVPQEHHQWTLSTEPELSPEHPIKSKLIIYNKIDQELNLTSHSKKLGQSGSKTLRMAQNPKNTLRKI